MAEPKPFSEVKLLCGIIGAEERYFKKAEDCLVRLYGSIDLESPVFTFDFTDYYEKQMGRNLKRKFLSFRDLILPDKLSEIKLRTNQLEEEIRLESKESLRVVNLDPGYMTQAALIIATAKDFAHRIPLKNGIYAHLELLFTKTGVNALGWTYPDYKTEEYQKFFIEVRRIYLAQLKRN